MLMKNQSLLFFLYGDRATNHHPKSIQAGGQPLWPMHTTESLSKSIHSAAMDHANLVSDGRQRCLTRKPRIQWMWNSADNPWSAVEPDEWKNFADVENMILEHAFVNGKDTALLDDYHVNFENNVQISNDDKNRQRPVKRTTSSEQEEQPLRQSRFMSNPIALKASFRKEHVLTGSSAFTKAALKQFDISYKHLGMRLSEIVELAALGLVAEGKLMGKKREGEWMAEQLIKIKQGTIEQVGECCAHLYTMESFLCQKLNETMRLVADDEHQSVWRSRLETFGPFAILLEHYISEMKSDEPMIVYRGANLTDEMIHSYRSSTRNKPICSDEDNMSPSFPAFTSCSRNRAKAEAFGNVLFIIELPFKRSVDVSKFSEYPDEEEELIKPGAVFLIERVAYDVESDKYLVYLSVI